MAKKKAAAQQTSTPTTVTTTTMVSFGCIGSVCVASDPYPIHLGPAGTQVTMCALNTTVVVKFNPTSPFTSGTKKFTIQPGDCTALETVAATADGTSFKFTLKCTGCPTPSRAPEMIVP